MINCDNCSTSFDPSKDGIQVTAGGRVAAGVFGGCCNDVRVGKIVLRRGDVGGFSYEQWAPMEMMAGGLTSKRAG